MNGLGIEWQSSPVLNTVDACVKRIVPRAVQVFDTEYVWISASLSAVEDVVGPDVVAVK